MDVFPTSPSPVSLSSLSSSPQREVMLSKQVTFFWTILFLYYRCSCHLIFNAEDGTVEKWKGKVMSQSPNRLIATIFGGVYLLVGVLGFFVAGSNFAGEEGGLLLGIFQVNHLHNIIHLLIGAALLAAGLKSVALAKRTNTVVGAVYLLLGIIGFFLVGTALNILALNTADHILHLGSALVLLGVGLAADKTADSAMSRRATIPV